MYCDFLGFVECIREYARISGSIYVKFLPIAVLKKVRYALGPHQPYALGPHQPYALGPVVPHMRARKAIVFV